MKLRSMANKIWAFALKEFNNEHRVIGCDGTGYVPDTLRLSHISVLRVYCETRAILPSTN